MAGKISVTRKELAALRWICERSGLWDDDREGRQQVTELGKLLVKAEKSHQPPPDSGVEGVPSFGQLESLLLDVAGKVTCRMGKLTAAQYVIAHRQVKEMGITLDQMRTLGRWLRRQQWLKARVTLGQVLRNWGSWYGQAAAEEEKKPTGPAPLE